MTYKTKQAQILVITLLILGIITIGVLSIISILNRDTAQVVNNKKFEIVNNAAEINVTNAVKAHQNAPTLGDLSSQIPTCTFTSNTGGKLTYTCQDGASVFSPINVRSTLVLEDKRDIVNKELASDESLSVNLQGYKGSMRIEWSGNFALEFNLILRTPTGSWVNVNDVFDRHNVFNSLAGDNPFVDPNNIHDFVFTDPATTAANDAQFDINQILNNLGYGTYTPQALIITPRNAQTANTLMSVYGLGAGFPNQIREFSAISFDNSDNASPTGEVKAELFLQPQIDSIFDYALLSPGIVNL